MKELEWSNKPPIVNGWYWFMKTDTTPVWLNTRKGIVFVHGRNPDIGPPVFRASFIGGSDQYVLDIGGMWAGPIEEPTA